MKWLIPFRAWTGKASLEIEISDDIEAPFRMRVALEIAVKSGAVLSDAVLRGADLRGAVLSGAVLSGAVLSDAVLRGADLRGAVLSDAVLRGADLRDADLRDADLRGADLRGAVLSDAVLSDADIPVIPNLDAAILDAIEAGGKLNMGSWHGYDDSGNACGTTHCRAGWAIHLAGEKGYALEKEVGSAAAGALIYVKSGAEKVPNFYCTDDEAMADMRERAAAAKAA